MKGTIIKCLEELVSSQYGKEKWQQSLDEAGLNKTTMFLPFADIDDAMVMNIMMAVCKNLNLSLPQAAEAFGDYWVNVYSQKMYPQYYIKHKTAKDFLVNMDNLHAVLTKSIKNSNPPRFEFEWRDENTLIMHYKSQRGMIDFVVGLIKGIGRYYHENIRVKKIGADRVQVIF